MKPLDQIIKLKKSKLTILAGLILIILIAPLLLISKYNLPWWDDYSVATATMAKDYLDLQAYWYMNWSGRYTSSGLIPLINPLNYSYAGISYYGTLSVLIICLFSISLFRFVSAIFPKAPIDYKLSLLAGVLFILLFILPSPTEFFFWFVGAWTYTLGVIIALEAGSGMLRLKSKYKRSLALYVSILCILLPGTNEVVTLIFIAIYSIIILLTLLNRQKISKFNYLIMTILGVFVLVSFMAPGNTARAEWGIEAGLVNRNLGEVILITFKEVSKYILRWTFLSPFLIVSFLSLKLLPYLHEDLKDLVNTPTKFSIWFLSSNLAVFAFIFPAFWSSGDAPDRVYNPVALYFILSAGISILLLFNLMRNIKIVIPFPVTLMICTFLFFHTLSSRNRISRVWIELRSGEARAYYFELNKNFEFCRSNPNQKIVLSPMSNRPYTIFMDDLRPDSTNRANLAFSKFHGIASVRAIETNAAFVETNSDTTLFSK